VLLYTVILVAVSVLPYAAHMSGLFYLAAALALGGVYLHYAVLIYVRYSDALAKRAFRYSIVYLSALFAALLADHYLPV
jgi:protoheme IX farnesyltransferase